MRLSLTWLVQNTAGELANMDPHDPRMGLIFEPVMGMRCSFFFRQAEILSGWLQYNPTQYED
jgi:hypothetical protein